MMSHACLVIRSGLFVILDPSSRDRRASIGFATATLVIIAARLFPLGSAGGVTSLSEADGGSDDHRTDQQRGDRCREWGFGHGVAFSRLVGIGESIFTQAEPQASSLD